MNEKEETITTKNTKFIAFTNNDFRLMWRANLLSVIGDQMQVVAIGWHVYLLTHSALALGLIGLSTFVPLALFSLFGGSIADRINRKKLLIIIYSLYIILSLLLAFTTVLKIITPTFIFVVNILFGVLIAFETPASQSIIPHLVRKEHMTNAISLSLIMQQIAKIAGPSLGGLVIAGFGPGAVYFINAVSFLLVISALVKITYSGGIANTGLKLSFFKSIAEGFSFIRKKTIIWSTMLLDFFSNFFGAAASLMPIFANDILKVGPLGLGLLYAAPSIGAVITGIVIAQKERIYEQGKILLFSIGIYAIATIMFGLSKIFIFSFIALIIAGAGDSISSIIRNTIRQLETPDHIKGRMTAINMIFYKGGPRLGEFEAGVVASSFGAPFSAALGGILTFISVLLINTFVPSIKKYKIQK